MTADLSRTCLDFLAAKIYYIGPAGDSSLVVVELLALLNTSEALYFWALLLKSKWDDLISLYLGPYLLDEEILGFLLMKTAEG